MRIPRKRNRLPVIACPCQVPTAFKRTYLGSQCKALSPTARAEHHPNLYTSSSQLVGQLHHTPVLFNAFVPIPNTHSGYLSATWTAWLRLSCLSPCNKVDNPQLQLQLYSTPRYICRAIPGRITEQAIDEIESAGAD